MDECWLFGKLQGTAVGKCQSVTPQAAGEARQCGSNAGGLKDLRCLPSLLHSTGGSSLMVSCVMLQNSLIIFVTELFCIQNHGSQIVLHCH